MSAVLLLIHDNDTVRRFVAHVLEQQGQYIVLSASDSDGALQALHKRQPIVVPDALLVGAALHAAVLGSPLRRHLPQVRRMPVLVLDDVPGTAIAAAMHRVAPDPRELLLRLRSVLRPSPPERQPLVREGLRLDPEQQQAWAGHLHLSLTPLAFRLLHFLMGHPGRVYTRTQLLEAVWADQGFVEERTVDVHVYRLRGQLARYGYGHLIEAVRGSGYRFAPEPPRKRSGGTEIRFAS